MRGKFSFLLFLASLFGAFAYDNGAGQTPPMGWNTWCTDDICGLIDLCYEEVIKEVADSFVTQGLDKLGYKYINLDDCWSDTERTSDGQLQPNPQQFPSGMQALADYIHGKGLKLGLYTCVGTHTCKRKRPGSFGYYETDAKTLAGWGVDFVKADNCNRPSGYSEQELYTNFSRALNSTGRPIFFSMCEWGDESVQDWGAEIAQMYRIQMDHLPLWHWPGHAAGMGVGQGTRDIIQYVGSINPSSFVKQYGYMDPDFLETLFPITMTFTDSKTEYSFWSLWSSPLICATDMRNMSDEAAYILANPEVIAINQDELFQAGQRVANYTNGAQIWYKDLLNGDKAVILFNSGDIDITVAVSWTMIGWSNTDTVSLRDMWERIDVGNFTKGHAEVVRPHDVFFFRATLSN